MSDEHKWRHVMVVTKARGKWKASCVCGWQYQQTPHIEEAEYAYKLHVGLVEKEPRREAHEQ